jgi:DNA-binding transcriptional MerR regulator
MAADLTIEQLAAESGMSVRNIRAHQARGLLAPPEVRLRVGYYGAEHVAQLRLIRELQADGFNLAGIKRLLDQGNATAERLERFRQVLTAEPDAERPQTLTVAELERRFGANAARWSALERAQRLGVLRSTGGGRYEAPSPSLLEVAERVVQRGVSLDRALAVFEQVEQHCDAISAAFVALFMTEVWEPFQRAGMPVERWSEIDAAIAALRPLATDALVGMFEQRLSAQVEAAFGASSPAAGGSGDGDGDGDGGG